MQHGLGSIRMDKHYLNFQQVRRQAGLTSRAVAETAGVPLRDEYIFELGAKVDQETRHKIIHALSRLTGQSYTIHDFEPERTTKQELHTPEKAPLSYKHP